MRQGGEDMFHPCGDLKMYVGNEVYILMSTGYEGPVILDKITKAGHALVVHDLPIPTGEWPVNYANQKRQGVFVSTILSCRIATKERLV
jgi:hypothetical protein